MENCILCRQTTKIDVIAEEETKSDGNGRVGAREAMAIWQ
jgi:hypothetical protein